jgi:hypothetical protein
MPPYSSIDLEARWGTWIYDVVEAHNNTVDLFGITEPDGSNALGLSYTFESHNDAPTAGFRGISRAYPALLFKVFTQWESPYREYGLYKNGQRFFIVFEEDDFMLMRADQRPMIQSLMPEHRADPELHALAVRYGERSEEDTSYDDDIQQALEDARASVESHVEVLRERLQ